MIFKLFILLFCFLHAQEEKPVEQEEIFSGFNFGSGFDNYGRKYQNYNFLSFNQLSFNEDGYEEHSLGVYIGGYEGGIALLEQKERTDDNLNALVLLAFLNNCPIPFYYVMHGYLIAKNEIASLFYGVSWNFNVIPVHFVLALHLKKDRYLIVFSVQKNIFTLISSDIEVGCSGSISCCYLF